VAERPGALEGLGVSAAALPDRAFWAGKRVLVTGHTGFKGGWLTLWLREMGAEVTGFARAPDTDPSLFHLAQVERGITSLTGDLCDAAAVRRAIDKARPEIVIHLAAQAIVRRAIAAPAETFASNVLGTAMLLEALRGHEGLAAILVVTSDLAVRAFGSSYFDAASIPLATARGGNIIGGGDFAPDRLVPDIVRAVLAGAKPALRHPDATRPWQHVLDCLAGYLLFVEALAAGKSVRRALNFGPEPGRPLTVRTLTEAVLGALGAGPVWDHAPEPGSLDMNSLTLDASAARRALGWGDRLAGGASVTWTAEWYRAFAGGADMRAATLRQIADYTGGAAGST
jgi:CDP-glucose 4,6-dehydratase